MSPADRMAEWSANAFIAAQSYQYWVALAEFKRDRVGAPGASRRQCLNQASKCKARIVDCAIAIERTLRSTEGAQS